MKKLAFLLLIVLGAMALAQTASAKARPAPILPPVTPDPEPLTTQG